MFVCYTCDTNVPGTDWLYSYIFDKPEPDLKVYLCETCFLLNDREW